MSVRLDDLIARADLAVPVWGMRRRRCGSTGGRGRRSCCFATSGAPRSTAEGVTASLLEFLVAESEQGRIKEGKRKLLREAVLVLFEVATTGTYTWELARASHPTTA